MPEWVEVFWRNLANAVFWIGMWEFLKWAFEEERDE